MDTSQILTSLSQPDLTQAMDDNLGLFWTGIGADFPDTAAHRDEKIAWLSSSIDVSYFNIVIPLRLPTAEYDAAITASIERAKARQVRTMWWLSQAQMSAGLGERLAAHGFALVGNAPGMAIDLAQLNEDIPRPAGFEIQRVETEAMLVTWMDTMAEAWPLPQDWRDSWLQGLVGYGWQDDLRYYIAYLDGRPSAVSSVLYGAGVAGIYSVATLSEARGRGLGALVVQAALLDAREAGWRVGILQASDMGHPVYLRLGFQEIFRYQLYMWPAPKEK